MARYTGPRVKKMRSLGVDLPGLSRKTRERRPYPPGQHGQGRRRKLSDYGMQLQEKQKLRLNYGVGERQFRRIIKEARASRMAAGQKILELLERRLDNVIFRAGYAPTIPAARQLVTHGHFLVNGRRVDIASYRVEEGDVIQPRSRSYNLAPIEESLAAPTLSRPDWIEYADDKRITRIAALPEADSVPFEVDISLVIEYYAQRL